jgi:hypothetical protein
MVYMSVQTNVSRWQDGIACRAQCVDCVWEKTSGTPSRAISRARLHAATLGHTVRVERQQHALVTASEDDFEAFGVANAHVHESWLARDGQPA